MISINTANKWYNLVLSFLVTLFFVLINYIFEIPNPNVILLTVIVFLTFTGGFLSGIISGIIVIVYSFVFFSISGQWFHYSLINLQKVIVIAIFVPILIVLVGILKRRAETKTKELADALKKLELVSKIDYLTEIPNRRFFDEFFINEYEHAADTDIIMACAIVDIDFFKQYNDSYGHLAGDQCLKMVAEMINKIAGQTGGFLARFGGEEFIILWSNSDENSASQICKEIVAAIEELHLPHESSTISAYVTVSIGLSTVKTKEQDRMKLLEHADKALYRAKHQGRNQINIY